MPKVTVTLAFDSLDEAFEALMLQQTTNIIVPLPDPVPTPLGASERPDVQPTPATGKKPRQPRSDAGQPRGPYKKSADAGNPASSTPGTSPGADAGGGDPVTPEGSSTQPTAAAPAPSPAAAPKELTVDDLKAAMTVLAKKKNIEANMAVLRKFGVGQVSKLPKEHYTAFLAAVNAAAGVA
jgi:hypothetical protein